MLKIALILGRPGSRCQTLQITEPTTVTTTDSSTITEPATVTEALTDTNPTTIIESNNQSLNSFSVDYLHIYKGQITVRRQPGG